MIDHLSELEDADIAIWLDDLSRERLRTGNLSKLVRDRHVVGVTTNPSIFQKAMSEGSAYDEQLRDLALRGCGVDEAVRALQAFDVRWGCEVLRPVYDRTGGVDGRVSYEVDPRIAHDTSRTVAEAKALWWLVDRPNLFIKIPATVAGLPAITAALAEGISVNITLIFSLDRYAQVIDAFLAGMEAARENAHDLSGIGSVASFFVSRVDTEIDRRLDTSGREEPLRGKAAVANAVLAYQHYQRAFSSDRWKALEQVGARPQRPLWASTGVKDPAYVDTKYVAELVAAGTVNTMPDATMNAFFQHGAVRRDAVTSRYAQARGVLDGLAAAGVDYDDVVSTLEVEGVQKFNEAWQGLLTVVEARLQAIDADNGIRRAS